MVANGDITSVEEAAAAFAASGADAIMVGRGAQGRPWFPGALARTFASGKREAAPPLAWQHRLVADLYDEMLLHHGRAIGVRHARKHLGWALDVAASCAGASADMLRGVRARVLTADDPADVLQRLANAYDAFAARALVIPDASRSEAIRDPSTPASEINRETGIPGSRLSRLAALGQDDSRKSAPMQSGRAAA